MKKKKKHHHITSNILLYLFKNDVHNFILNLNQKQLEFSKKNF